MNPSLWLLLHEYRARDVAEARHGVRLGRPVPRRPTSFHPPLPPADPRA